MRHRFTCHPFNLYPISTVSIGKDFPFFLFYKHNSDDRQTLPLGFLFICLTVLTVQLSVYGEKKRTFSNFPTTATTTSYMTSMSMISLAAVVEGPCEEASHLGQFGVEI